MEMHILMLKEVKNDAKKIPKKNHGICQ